MNPKDCKPAIDFLKKLTKHDKALVLIDGDADGLTSGVILTEYLDEKNVQYKPVVLGGDYRRAFNEKVNELMKEDDYNTFIMADWSTNTPETVNELANKGIKTLIIDHHHWNEEPNEKVAYVNPWNEKQDYPATAGLALYTYEEAGGQKDLKWLGYIGCTTDTLIFKSLNLLRLPEEQKNGLMPNGIPLGFTELMPIINSAYLNDDIGLPIFKLLKKSVKENSPLYMLIHKDSDAKQVFDLMKHAQEEVDEAMQSLKEDALIDHEAKWVYLKIKPKLNIKRKLVNLLRDAFPEYTTSVGNEKDGVISISTRSVKPILTDIIPKSVEGFGYGGGHPAASGCGFKKEHEPEWIHNMKRLLKENKS